MACVVLAVIILMVVLLGAELGPKADPTTTTYTPRPEWYFFFLFELLRVVKPPRARLPRDDRHPDALPRPAAAAAVHRPQPGAQPAAAADRDHGRHRDDRAMAYLTVLERSPARRPRSSSQTAAVRGGQGGHGLLGLPRLPQDRRERQHGSGRNLTEIGPAAGPTRSRARSSTRRRRCPRTRRPGENPEQFDELVEYVASLKGETLRGERAAGAGPMSGAPRPGRCPRPRCGRCSTASRASTTR